MSKLNKPQWISGSVCLLAGLYYLAVSFALLPNDSTSPNWVIGVIGLLFFVVGGVLIRGKMLESSSLLASLMLLCFSLVGFWVAFMDLANTPLVVKFFVGSGSLICLMLSLMALRDKSDDT